MEAIEHRARSVSRASIDLDDVKIAYMDLYNHAPDLAAQLMAGDAEVARRASGTMPAACARADVDAFDKWLSERDGIAKQTASLAAANAASRGP